MRTKAALSVLAIAALLGAGCASLDGGRAYSRGVDALDRGDTETAIAELEYAAQRVPDASEVHNNLGVAYQQAGRYDAALAQFEYAVALDCDNQAAQRNLDAAQAHRERQRSRAVRALAHDDAPVPDAAGTPETPFAQPAARP